MGGWRGWLVWPTQEYVGGLLGGLGLGLFAGTFFVAGSDLWPWLYLVTPGLVTAGAALARRPRERREPPQ